MKITNPEMKVVRFENEDVIATSMFIIADDESGTFSIFEGSMYGPVEEGVWNIGTNGEKNEISQDEIDNIKAGYTGAYNSWYGIPVYDAYKEDSYYRTKGASYYEMYGNQ